MKPKKNSGPTVTSNVKKVLLIKNNKRSWVWTNGDGVDYPNRKAAEAALEASAE